MTEFVKLQYVIMDGFEVEMGRYYITVNIVRGVLNGAKIL